MIKHLSISFDVKFLNTLNDLVVLRMNFCFCGNSTCICETSCTCIQRECFCSKCHNLRKDLPFEYFSPVESDLPSSSRDLAPSVGKHEVANEAIAELDSSVTKIDSRAKDLQQGSSNQSSEPIEQEMAAVQDIGGNRALGPKSCSSKCFSWKDPFGKTPKKQVYTAITLIDEPALLSNDDSESSSDEIPVAKEAIDYFSSLSSKFQETKIDPPDSEKLSSDTSSASTQSSSGISILELPVNDWDPSLQADSHSVDNLFANLASNLAGPDENSNLLHFIAPPDLSQSAAIFCEEAGYDDSAGRSISPIQVLSRNPTALVSPSGEMYLLPLRNSQSLRPQTPPSSSVHVPQSSNSSKVSPGSADVPSADATPKIMQNLENLQTECREKTTVETCASNVPETERNDLEEEKENLPEENSTTVSDKKLKSRDLNSEQSP